MLHLEVIRIKIWHKVTVFDSLYSCLSISLSQRDAYTKDKTLSFITQEYVV
jgi:hypothetical protein